MIIIHVESTLLAPPAFPQLRPFDIRSLIRQMSCSLPIYLLPQRLAKGLLWLNQDNFPRRSLLFC